MASKQEKAKAKAIKLLKREAKEKAEAESKAKREAELRTIKEAKRRELKKIANEAKSKAKKIKKGNLSRSQKATLDDPITIFGITFPKRSYFLLTVSVFFVVILFVASSIPRDVSVTIRAGCYDINSDPCGPINVVFTDENGNQRALSAILDDEGYWEYNYDKSLDNDEEWPVNVTLEALSPGKYLVIAIFSDDVMVGSKISDYGDDSLSVTGIAMHGL